MSEILFPCGRMIGGSVYKAQVETDNSGKPKLNTDGTPITSFTFGVAIPKGGESHWNQTQWGAKAWAIAQAAHPQQHAFPSYAWKIKDGDSKVPNRVGKIPANSEGHAGNWIIWFKQSWAPKLVTEGGALVLIEPEAIMPGYFIEVFADVKGNTGPTPGLYMNPIAVNRVAFGPRLITASVDTASVGFGSSPIPAGASATPVGGSFNPAPTQAAPAPAAIVPNPAFLAIPAVPVAPAAPPAKVLTAKAGSASYESFIAKGWTDELLTQHGYM